MTLPAAIPPETLVSLAELVETRSGLRFVGARRQELAMKLGRAFAESGRASWREYEAELSSSEGLPLLDELVEKLTIGETYFYRHRAFFDMLEHEVLPEIIARRRSSRRLHVWCAGCASGEEAYSLAIAIRRVLPDLADWHVSVLATDLNRVFLGRAKTGVYTDWSFRETDAHFKAEYFVPVGSHHQIRPELHKLVRFAQLNLAEDRYPSAVNGTSGLDLILCRNVLLYFGPDLTQRVVDRLRAALVPGGWLMLGPSDPRPGRFTGFNMHARDGALAYQRVVDDVPVMAAVRTVEPTFPEVPTFDWTIHASSPVVVKVDDAPSWRDAWMAARASADAGELEQAEAHCQRAVASAPYQPEPYYFLGSLLQLRGDEAESLAAFRKALFVDASFVPALVAQAAQYRREGCHHRARQVLLRAQRLLESRPADAWVLPEDGLTVGRLRDAVAQALSETGEARD